MSEGNVECHAKQVLLCKITLKQRELAQKRRKIAETQPPQCAPLLYDKLHVFCFQMQQQSQLASLEAMAKQNAEDAQRIRRERDEALREVQHLKKLLKKKEEECLTAEEELMKARRVRGSIACQGSFDLNRAF